MWKKGQALVPTWTAFAVVGLMEKHFDELVDYAFTARIEEDLDSIARNERQKQDWLQHFYFGDDDGQLPGLKRLVEENLDEIDAAEINTFPIGIDPDGNEIVVKPGKYGPYVKRGDDTASVPDDLTPDELTRRGRAEAARRTEERRADRRARRLPGVRQERSLRPVRAVGHPRQPAARASRSRRWPACSRRWRSSASPSTTPRRCCSCRARWASIRPTAWRSSPTTAATARTCRRARTTATSTSEEQLLTITLEEALEIFSQPKVFRRGGGTNMAAKGPLREFGIDPVSGKAVVAKDGKFGVYVTDGETNASLSKGDRLEAMPPERAYELLAIRREAIIEKGGAPGKRAAATKKAAAKRSAPAKKAAAKKAAAKKAAPKEA